jgi:hypothetical protein
VRSRRPTPAWLSRIETLGTTLIVLLVGGMVIWYEAIERETRLVVTIASAVLLYLLGLVVLGRRSDPHRIAWWPFALAGAGAGAVAELINAQFMVTRELLTAGATGLVIGTAQWTALRIWIGVTRRSAA